MLKRRGSGNQRNVTRVTDDKLTEMNILKDNTDISGTKFPYETKSTSMQNLRNGISIPNRKITKGNEITAT